MIERRQDLIFANQTRSLLEWLAAAWPARAPAPLRLVHLLCGTLEGTGQKMFDFSATTLDWRWRRGLDLGRRALALLDDEAGNGPAFDLRVCS